MEALQEQLEKCKPCKLNSEIVTFWELPEHEKFNFDYYDESKHYILHCAECDKYKILGD